MAFSVCARPRRWLLLSVNNGCQQWNSGMTERHSLLRNVPARAVTHNSNQYQQCAMPGVFISAAWTCRLRRYEQSSVALTKPALRSSPLYVHSQAHAPLDNHKAHAQQAGRRPCGDAPAWMRGAPRTPIATIGKLKQAHGAYGKCPFRLL